MWFKFIVVGVKAVEKGRTAAVFLNYRGNESPFHVPDQQLAAFCLPLGPESQSQKERMSHEEYTFTLTQGDGSRVQGFCRRCLPPAPRIGSKLRFPQVLCLVCEASWSALFFKVLEAVEQLLQQTDLLLDFGNRELPADSYAGQFLSNLAAALADQPQLGSVIRIPLPAVPTPLSMSPPKRVMNGMDTEPLQFTNQLLELQVPPDCGNGTSNAGVSLARLLWHVPVPAMLTLIASLLLERRVLVVGQSRDMVSAAVCAAAALIYPFKWHHIYLPLLPRSFKDYLTAPMPFLIGMPAQLLPTLKGIPMDEVTLIDLDLGRCEPSAGSANDDALRLPWKEQLEAALHAAFGMLRSPTEHESNTLITNIMQGYFLKLVGSYRSHIYPEGVAPGTLNGLNNSLSPSPSTAAIHQSTSTGSLAGLGSAREDSFRGSSSLQSPRDGSTGRHTPTGSVVHDDSMKGFGFWFDHSGLVASLRRNERARSFLQLLRQSQMYEMFIQERLKMFAAVPGGPEMSGDPFEQLVNSYLDNRSRRLAARLGAGVRSGLSRFTAFVKKHRRTGSNIPEAGGLSGGFGSSFAESPEAQRIKQLAAAFASVAVGAGHMRRNFTEGNHLASLSSEAAGRAAANPHHRHTLSTVEGLADRISNTLDPSAFFEDDEDELDAEAADAAAAAAAAASSNGRSGLSRNSSSSSLKDMIASAASWTAGPGNSSRGYRGSAGGALEQQQQRLPQSLQRQSVPAPTASAGGNLARQSTPLIDLRQNSPNSSGSSRPGSTTPPHQPHGSQFLQQQQQHLQQQQQQQHQERPMRSSLSSIADQLMGPSSSSSLGQQHRPRSPAAVAAFAATIGHAPTQHAAAAAGHRTPQHLNLKAALASIAPGPLPQPPQPKPRSSSSHLTFNSVLGTAGSSSSGTHAPGAGSRSSVKPPLQPQQQQQPAAVWDPFTELVQERSSSTAAVQSASVTLEQQQQQHQQLQHIIDKGPALHQVELVPSSLGSGYGSSVDSPVSKAVSSSRGSSSSDGGAYASSTCSTLAATDPFFTSSRRGISGSDPGTASQNSSLGSQQRLQQQQQPEVGDLLQLEAQLPNIQRFSSKDAGAQHLGAGAVVHSLIDLPLDAAVMADSSATKNTQEKLLDVQIGLDSCRHVDVAADGRCCSSSGAGATAAAEPLPPAGSSGDGSRYTTAESSAVPSSAGDAGLAQLEDLLMQQRVSVARSDSLLDM